MTNVSESMASKKVIDAIPQQLDAYLYVIRFACMYKVGGHEDFPIS